MFLIFKAFFFFFFSTALKPWWSTTLIFYLFIYFNWKINRLEKDQKYSFYMFFSKCLLHFSADLLIKLGWFSLVVFFFLEAHLTRTEKQTILKVKWVCSTSANTSAFGLYLSSWIFLVIFWVTSFSTEFKRNWLCSIFFWTDCLWPCHFHWTTLIIFSLGIWTYICQLFSINVIFVGGL